LDSEDRKLGWALFAVLAIIAAELLLFLFVGPINRGANSQSNQEPNYWEWVSSSAFWTACATGLIAWYTVVLSRVSNRQADIAERALIELERAYVFAEIRDPGIAIGGPGTPMASFRTLELRLFNCGRVPAFPTSIHWDVVLETPQRPDAPTSVLPNPFDPGNIRGREIPAGIVVHNERIFFETMNLFGHFDMEARASVPQGDRTVWCYGFFRYTDGAGGRYLTGFCFVYDLLAGRFVQWGDRRYNYTRKEG
jgi:hypothetical protein